MSKDLFQAPDYYLVDGLLTDEQKLVRDSARAFVKKEISPIIEEYAQKARVLDFDCESYLHIDLLRSQLKKR